ncbi:MAG: hypothetical protein SGBAC_000508 [Bacillariaceae sp.]
MTFEINKGSTDKIFDWNGVPKGWLIHDRDDFRIAIEADVGWIDSSLFSRVAFEVQLCNIDNIMLCQPVIAPNTFFDDITGIDDIQNLQTTRTPSVTRFVDLDTAIGDTIQEELNFGKITVPGTYRILSSLVVSNTTAVSGVSMISGVKYLMVDHNDPMELSSESQTAIVILSSVAGTVILFLLFQTFTYRKAQVFQLTQGKFIIAMQVCALVATSSLIFFAPRDPFCQLSPLLYLSTHMVYAILLGRMWRVRAVISPLLLLTLERKDDWTTKIVDLIGRFTACACWQGQQQKKIRMQITDGQLARVIMLLISPQLLVQILILSVYYDNKSILLDVERDGIVDGIYICKYGPFYSTLHIIAVSLIGIEFFLLALLMWGSRDLPSLFNETKKVWQILRATFVFVLSGSLLVAATIDHYNTAQVRVLVPAFVLGLTMCQTCWSITWSKLRVAWRGQTILVTKLIADHNFNRGKSEAMRMGSTQYFAQKFGNGGTKFSGYQGAAVKTETKQSHPTTGVEEEPSIDIFKEESQTEQIASDDRSTDSSVFLAESQETVLDIEESEEHGVEGVASPDSDDSISLVDGSSSTSMGTNNPSRRKPFSPLSYFRRDRRDKRNSNASGGTRGSTASRGSIPRGSMVVRRRLGRGGGLASSTISAKTDDGALNRFSVFGHASMPTTVVVESIDMNPRLSNDKIRISETEAPGRRLLLRMIDVQRMLAKVNMSLLTGESLDREHWSELRVGCVTLGEVFENEVVFAWDNDDGSSMGSMSASHKAVPHHPNNRGPMHASLPPRTRVTSTTNAGPRRSVTFKTPEKKIDKEKDNIMGSMLRAPLEPIMSIGSPVVREKDGILLEVSESSTADEIHDQNEAKVNHSGLQGAKQPLPDSSIGKMTKHRVRANPSASLPADLPIDQLRSGEVKTAEETLPMHDSGISASSEGWKSEATSEMDANMPIDQMPLGQFQKGTQLSRVSGISDNSENSDKGSDKGRGSPSS